MTLSDENTYNDLTRILLEEEPENWPPVWRALNAHPEQVSMSAQLQARIQTLLDDAIREQKQQDRLKGISGNRTGASSARPRYFYLAAALSPFILGLSIWALTGSFKPIFGTESIAVAHLSGAARVLSPGERVGSPRKLSVLDRVASKETLSVSSGGELYLKGENDTWFYIQGPARIKLKRFTVETTPIYHFFIEKGNISIRSDKSEIHGEQTKKIVIWETTNYIYRMAGTVARLSAEAKRERLGVLSGAFEVTPKPSGKSANTITKSVSRKIPEGFSLTLQTDQASARTPGSFRNPSLEPLGVGQKRDLNRLNSNTKRLNQNKNPFNPTKKFQSEREIYSYYGEISIVTLKDGLEIKGFVTEEFLQLRVHTLNGEILIPREMVVSLK